MKMLRLHYHELVEKIKEHEGKKYLMVGVYMLDKVSDKIKEIIGIWKLDDTKISIDADDRLADNITLKNVVTLITCVTKDDNKFYPQLFLEEAFYHK